PGFYGGRFIPVVLEKIQRFRGRHPSLTIGIDGGVSLDNIPEIKSVGVDYACVGSRIFLSGDPAASYVALSKRAEE
ncbi:MAG: ribulose-phosphate 3-epimerase, partial [Deltaproteobacteria bacterium]|nr:ribulose-phosphate 3-epimerase [Deltaproteobacteria bacterium]